MRSLQLDNAAPPFPVKPQDPEILKQIQRKIREKLLTGLVFARQAVGAALTQGLITSNNDPYHCYEERYLWPGIRMPFIFGKSNSLFSNYSALTLV